MHHMFSWLSLQSLLAYCKKKVHKLATLPLAHLLRTQPIWGWLGLCDD